MNRAAGCIRLPSHTGTEIPSEICATAVDELVGPAASIGKDTVLKGGTGGDVVALCEAAGLSVEP